MSSVKLRGTVAYKSGEEWTGNKSGRPRRPEIEAVREAIEATAIEKKKTLWKHLIEQCYEDNNVLIAVGKKFLPDKIQAEIEDTTDYTIIREELARAYEDRFKKVV